MKIGYFADGPWSHLALNRILAEGDIKVAFVTARHDSPDAVLRELAKRLDVPFYVVSDVNDKNFLEQIRKQEVELNVSMSFNQFLKSDLIDLAPRGFINCHAGALPYYRGRNILNWALINGEKEFGVTVHFVDVGIDTGDIIAQTMYPIGPVDDYRKVLQTAYEGCAETLLEALQAIRDGEVSPRPQREIHPVGFYCGMRQAGDEGIDWEWSSERIHNFVRALSPPGPGARTTMGDKAIAVLATSLIPKAPDYLGIPGQVVGRDSRGLVVKTGNTTIMIEKIAAVADGHLLEPCAARFRIGTRLESPRDHELRKVVARTRELEERIAALEAGMGDR